MIGIIGWGGAPAVGKSTLMKQVLSKLEEPGQYTGYKTAVLARYSKNHIIVLGKYDSGRVFGGTDRLPMNVQPVVLDLIHRLHYSQEWNGWIVLLEGDRLFNEKFLTWLAQHNIPRHFLVIQTDPIVLTARRNSRSQNLSWVKGRETKVQRLAQQFQLPCYPHNTPEDTQLVATVVMELIRKTQEQLGK